MERYQTNPRDYILFSLLKLRNPNLSEEAYISLPEEILVTECFWTLYPKTKSADDLLPKEKQKWEKFLSYYFPK